MWLIDTADGLNYSAIERILAYYGEFKWDPGKWEILGGLRIEQTHHSYNSLLSVFLPGKSGNYINTDFLPSLNVKYKLSPRKDLRFSYFSGISRPDYYEYIPVDKPGDYFDETGNPNLKHTQSYNTDLRFEQFINGEDYFMVGTFYKYLINPIEYGFVQLGTSSGYYEPQNFGNATNFGAELIFEKHWRNFGINGNYSYTRSSITTTKRVFSTDASGNYVVYDTQQTRPLQGQSDHLANLAFLYKNFKNGINAELTWVYTGKRIDYISPYNDLDYWQKGTMQMGFSMDMRLTSHLTLFAKASNLLNSPLIVELRNNANGYYYHNPNYPDQTDPRNIIVQNQVFNRGYTLGIRYK